METQRFTTTQSWQGRATEQALLLVQLAASMVEPGDGRTHLPPRTIAGRYGEASQLSRASLARA